MIISVPATSANLGPGFDTLGLSLDLRNNVDVKKSNIFSVSIKGEGAKNPRLKGNNMFVNIFYEHYKNITGQRDNFRFVFDNTIPLSRGLGSSSAVIVSAITAAYEAADVRISKRKLLNHALVYEPHPDNITPAIMGGFNTAVVERNRVYSQKKVIPNYLKAVVVIPNQPISTAQSRTILPKSYSKETAVYNLSRTALMVSAFYNENWELLRIASRDRFHQKARMKTLPELFGVQKLAIDNGALMSTLSGSGSTFFNMVYAEDAPKMVQKLSSRYPEFRVLMLDFDNDGVIVSDS